MNKGILENKLNSYYKDINIYNYRELLCEAIKEYRGKNFKNILDIGCGIGSFIEAIKMFNFNILALEGSKIGLEVCSKKNINCKNFILSKNNALPFDNQSFSFVLMNQVIEHLTKEDGKYYIKEIIRILEPGGVCIIKSPSKYCKIWNTDPHHIYCWKPFELLNVVKKHESYLSKIKLERSVLEFWMMFKYNESIINKWHKNVKHKRIKKILRIATQIVDRVINKLYKNDKMLSVSNITFIKNGQTTN